VSPGRRLDTNWILDIQRAIQSSAQTTIQNCSSPVIRYLDGHLRRLPVSALPVYSRSGAVHVSGACPTAIILDAASSLSFNLPLMARSFPLDLSPKWILFRFAALNRVSRLIRRMHLSPTLVSYPRTGKSGRPLCVVSKDPDAQDLDGFGMFEVEQTLFKVCINPVDKMTF
jgi:hypothetical protein